MHFQAESLDNNEEEELIGLIDDLEEENLPSDSEIDTVDSAMMGVTEKRSMLGIELEARSEKMETIGEMPVDVGRNYILKKKRKVCWKTRMTPAS